VVGSTGEPPDAGRVSSSFSVAFDVLVEEVGRRLGRSTLSDQEEKCREDKKTSARSLLRAAGPISY